MRNVSERLPRCLLVACSCIATSGRVDAQAESGTLIEEVFVTAQKRAENLQQVPISITALSGDELREAGLRETRDLARLLPNVDIKNAFGNDFPVITIRGVGQVDTRPTSASSTAVHIDQVPLALSSPAALAAQLFDIERVEVLKGPQGTLYGRNTTAGTINFIAVKPTDTLDGFIDVRAGRFDNTRVEAALGGPLGDRVRVRIAGVTEHSNGWVTARALSPSEKNKPWGGADRYALRLTVDWDISEHTSISANAHGGQDRSQKQPYQFSGTVNPATRGRCSAIQQGYRDPLACTDFLGYSDRDGDPYAGDYNFLGSYDSDSQGFALNARHEMSWATLTSIIGYDEVNRRLAEEPDANPFTSLHQSYAELMRQFSQELRLTSADTGNARWILGAIYLDDQIRVGRDGNLFDRAPVYLYMDAVQDGRSSALFGQWELPFHERWKVTAGARYTRDEKSYRYVRWRNIIASSADVTWPDPPAGVPALDRSLGKSWNEVSGRLALDYRVSDDILTYASISRGYKAGGFPSGLTHTREQLVGYDPETVLAYEIGLKSFLFDRSLRLNLAGFYYAYRDMQVFTTIPQPPPNPNTQLLTNAAESTVAGLEAEMLWKPTERFEVALAAGWLDASFDKFTYSPDGVRDPTGNDLPNAPRFKTDSRAKYEVPLGGGSAVAASANYSWRDRTFFDLFNVPYLGEGSYGLVSARLAWTSSDKKIELALWGENLSDEVYLVDSFEGGGWLWDTYGTPRTYGVSALYRVQ